MNNYPRGLARQLISILLVSMAFQACDMAPIGFNTKQIAGGYRLIETEGPDQYALVCPHEEFASTITELGWQKPLIISHYASQDRWDVIDTSTGTKLTVSDTERRLDPKYKDIEAFPVAAAWKRLHHLRAQW